MAIVRYHLPRRHHWQVLQNEGRATRLDQLPTTELSAGYFLVTNTRFGIETWWLPKGVEPVPMTDGSYDMGVLILPPPRFKTLQQFCAERGVPLRQQAVKY
jgi:hypothetical protein